MPLLRFGLLALLALLACDRESPSETGKGEGTSTEAVLPALPDLWSLNRQTTFAFSASTNTILGALAPPSRITLRGKLLAFAKSENDLLTLTVRLEDLQLDGAKNPQGEAVAQLLEELSQPFALEFSDGLLYRYGDPEIISPLAHGFRRQIASALQLNRNGSGSKQSWQAEEWDASGLADVSYRRSGDGVHWEKLRYKKVLARQGVEGAAAATSWSPEVRKSSGKTEIQADGLVLVEREEWIEAELTPTSTLATQTTTALRRLRPPAESSPPDPLKFGFLSWSNADALPPPIDTSALDVLRAASRSAEEVIRELESMPPGLAHEQGQFRRRQEAFQALTALFRLDPKNVNVAVEKLRAGTIAGETILRALGASSAIAALEALGALAMDPKRSDEERRKAAASLLRAEVPPVQSLQIVERFLQDPLLKAHGLLGLGTFTRRFRLRRHDEQAARGTRLLAEHLKTAATNEERITVLLGIANAGSPEVFEQVLAFQSSTDPKVRDAALQAVRLMPDENVEARLRDFLQGARETSDRLAALTALSHRDVLEPSTVEIVVNNTRSELPPEVRREAALALSKWQRRFATARQALERLAKDDDHPRVVEVAREALTR